MSGPHSTPPGSLLAARDPHEYDGKIWNLPETPEMFHRQAPGLPMTTRCGLAMGDVARQTTHKLVDYSPCSVCFEGWSA